MSKQKTVMIGFRVNADVLRNIDNLAGAANVDRSDWIKAWLGHLANLKREYSFRAMADIPEERFKGLPGRPNTPKSDDETD